MTYLYLDTSVLLHYRSFEEIPWNQLLGISEAITLVICETVISEIDKHKDSQRGRLRDRAKKISKQLFHVAKYIVHAFHQKDFTNQLTKM